MSSVFDNHRCCGRVTNVRKVEADQRQQLARASDSRPSVIEVSVVGYKGGRIVGPKPPLKPKHIWAIRTRMQHDGLVRDLAMFNTAIDSKLRGCDLVKLRVSDIYLGDSVRLTPNAFAS